MEHKYQNLYNNPRLLYKYYSLSKEYAVEYKMGSQVNYLFTPNIPKMDMEKNNKVVDKWRLIVFKGLSFLFFTGIF